MSEQTAIRKLTAILYADVAGYSRLTGGDELGTHQKVMDTMFQRLVDLARYQLIDGDM